MLPLKAFHLMIAMTPTIIFDGSMHGSFNPPAG